MIITNDKTLVNLHSPLRQIEAKVELLSGGSTTSTVTKEGYSICVDNPKAQNIRFVNNTNSNVDIYRFGKNIIDYTKAEDRQGNPLTIIEDGVLWDKTINYYFYMPCFIPAGVGFDVSCYSDYEENPDTLSAQFQVMFEDGTQKAFTNGNNYWHIAKKNIIKIGFRKTNTNTTETTPIKVTHIQVELVDMLPTNDIIVSDYNENTIYRGYNPTEYVRYIAPQIVTASAGETVGGFASLPFMSFYAYSAAAASGVSVSMSYDLIETTTDTVTYTNKDAIKSIEIDRTAEEGKFFGFGISQKLKLNLTDKDKIIKLDYSNPYQVSFCADTVYINTFPDFYANESESYRDELTNDIELVAYDKLTAAAGYTLAQAGYTGGTMTDRQLAELLAQFLGLNLVLYDTSVFMGDTYAAIFNIEGTETVREVLDDLAEVSQSIYYIEGSSLIFKRLDKDGNPVLQISKADYFDLTSGAAHTLQCICHTTELGEALYSGMEGGTTQYVRNNCIWENRAELPELLDAAMAAVGGSAISQYSLSWRGNYLVQPGDKIAITTKDNGSLVSYLLNDTITYNGGYSQKSSWNYIENKSETANNPSTLGEAIKHTFAKVDKVNKEIEMVVSETQKNVGNIAELQLTTSTIGASVTSMEERQESTNEELEQLTQKVNATMTAEDMQIEIQKEVAKGTTKVTTTTGFTFDDRGLTVAKSGSEMETTITEDGMTVYRSGKEVLTANNTGVDATNLRATTYLVIGNNSRFEDYGSSRTGCFWIGG